MLLTRPTPSRHWKRDQKPRQRLRLSLSATVTVLAFAGLFNALRARLRCLPHL